MISYMISTLPSSNGHAVALAGADISPAIRTDHDSDSDRVMDPDEQRDYADQAPPSDSDLDGDTQILATLFKHIPECIDTADIELLLQDIPVQPPVVIPARTMQEAIQAEDMPHTSSTGSLSVQYTVSCIISYMISFLSSMTSYMISCIAYVYARDPIFRQWPA